MNLTEIAKRTYRRRVPERRPDIVFVCYDKRQQRYMQYRVPGMIAFTAARPEDAKFFDTIEGVYEALNSMVSRYPPTGVWAKYFEELGIAYENLEWEHLAQFFEIREIQITTRVVGKREIGTD